MTRHEKKSGVLLIKGKGGEVVVKRKNVMRIVLVVAWLALLLPTYGTYMCYFAMGAAALGAMFVLGRKRVGVAKSIYVGAAGRDVTERDGRRPFSVTFLSTAFSGAFSLAVALGNYKLFRPGKVYGGNGMISTVVFVILLVGGWRVMRAILEYVYQTACGPKCIMPAGEKPMEDGGRAREGFAGEGGTDARCELPVGSGKYPFDARRAKRWMFISITLVFAVQMLYLVFCRFPGGLQYDFLDQLHQVISGEFSNHHPIYHTMWIDLSYRVAAMFANRLEMTAFLQALFQIVVYSRAVAYVVVTLYEIGVPRKALLAVLAVYLFYPYHFFFGTYLNKDSLFTYAALIFVTALFRTARQLGNGRANCVFLFLGGLGLAMLRSNGWGALALVLVGVFVSRINEKRRLLVSIGVILAASALMKGSLTIFFDGTRSDITIEGVEYSESLSIPIQQVSRVIYEGRKLTEEQEALCNQLVNVEYVRENYNFWRSDEMKGQIQFWGRDAYMEARKGEYLRLWVDLGLKYPMDYLCAWIDMTSGYWNMAAGTSAYANLPYENDLQIENHVVLPRLNERINAILLAFQQNKVLHVFLNIGFHFWLMVVLFLAGIWRKKGEQVLCMPALAIVCTLFVATPLNGEPRYVYLLYATLPLIMAVMVWDKGGTCVKGFPRVYTGAMNGTET